MHRRTTPQSGFTLLEMLIALGIVAVLGVAAFFAVNPPNLLRQSRDAKRIAHLGLLNNAVSVLHSSNAAASLGSTTTVYVSVPDTSSTCGNLGLPALPSGWTYHCVTAANLHNVNGTGWIGVNFTLAPQGAPIDQLPVDPTNTTTTGQYYVYLVNRTWKFTTVFESAKYAPKMREDGGPDNVVYEVGTNLGLVATAQGGTPSTNGLVAYWKFDDGEGHHPVDDSGEGNDGSTDASDHWVNGQVGFGYDFSNDRMTVPDDDSMDLTGDMTISFIWKSIGDPASFDGRAIEKGIWEDFGAMEYCIKLHAAVTWSGYAGTETGWFFSGDSRNEGRPLFEWLSPHGEGNTLAQNEFHLVTIVRSNAMSQMYQDGDLLYEDATGYSTIGASSGAFSIGPAGGMPATLDEFRIYNRALSQEEIQTIYNALF